MGVDGALTALMLCAINNSGFNYFSSAAAIFSVAPLDRFH